jgi:Contact-dependent growth inhibition CdiA C-terminal domain
VPSDTETTADYAVYGRTPDARVNDMPVEFKSLDPGASDRTVKAALNSAKRQAHHAVIDAAYIDDMQKVWTIIARKNNSPNQASIGRAARLIYSQRLGAVATRPDCSQSRIFPAHFMGMDVTAYPFFCAECYIHTNSGGASQRIMP